MDDNDILELMQKEFDEAKKAQPNLGVYFSDALEEIIKKALQRAGLQD